MPVAVMTYVNPVYRHGFEAFLTDAERAGVAGVIVPDLPVDEAVEWTAACAGHGIASVQLAAPGTSDDRLAWIAKASTGFLYCVATYGVTGVRDELAGTARQLDRAAPAASRTSRSWWVSAWARPRRPPRWGRSRTARSWAPR